MRDIVFLVAFVSSIPLIFVSPFNGVIVWYAFSLGNFHTLTWGSFGGFYYGYIIAISTVVSWMISREKKSLPLTPLSVMTLIFMVWITMTTVAASPAATIPGHAWSLWDQWKTVEKILFMCLVGYALTTTRERVDQLIWVVVLAIGAWGVKGGIGSILHGGTARIHGPEGTAIGDNNDFGLALILILPLMFYKWQRTENRHIRRGLIVMAILVIIADLSTYSRGALVGLCAMGTVTFLRSRAKLAMGVLIVAVGLSAYAFAPPQWFNRMESIETYEQDSSAMSRIYMWQVGLQIAEEYPLFGGGFKRTIYPETVNSFLHGIPRLTARRDLHSIWFVVLSEHAWIGLALFLAIAGCSWINCSWLVRQSRGRTDLVWANLLGRMGQATLVGYWAGGTFLSQAYLDEYWCVIFIFDAARRVVSREIARTAASYGATPSMRLRTSQAGIDTLALPRPDLHSG
jgi:putative inorganic carbon (HCO3(-)) transporter